MSQGPLVARRWWVVASAVILVVGIAVSAAVARSWERSAERVAADDFRSAAGDLAATIAVEMRRNADLATATATLVSQRPDLTNAGFSRWVADLERAGGFASVTGFVYLERVAPDEALATIGRLLAESPSLLDEVVGGAAAIGGIRIPAGTQPICVPRFVYLGTVAGELDVSALARTGSSLDLCSGDDFVSAGARQRALESGGPVSTQRAFGQSDGYIGILVPVFDGPAPATGEARADALRGWLVGSYDAEGLLATAMGGDRDLGAQLVLHEPGERARPLTSLVRYDEPAVRRVSVPVRGDRAWTVTVSAPASAFPSGDSQSLGIFLTGAALALAVAALVRQLATSRNRALALVDEKTEELRHQALHDGLTGLPNRVLLLDRLEVTLDRARRTGRPAIALFLDLDGFKTVNDTFGHDAGDRLLLQVARRLLETVRESDTVGRLGGDEFLVLCDRPTDDLAPEVVAERIRQALRAPYVLDGVSSPVRVSCSIGIATASGEVDATELLRASDVALYRAKAGGRDRVVVFTDEMRDAFHDRVRLQLDLRHAVRRDELFVMYQPTVDLASNEVTGVEAVVRWQHPEQGVLLPDDFLPLAEEAGLIDGIGTWVLGAACRQAAAWSREGLALTTSVRVSARQLVGESFVAEVGRILATTGADPASMLLEVSEAALMADPETMGVRLGELRRQGIRIAVDQFGAGHSSLAYLRQFPIDCLKIDRSFVDAIGRSTEAEALVDSLVVLGNALGFHAITEGVEIPRQIDRRPGGSPESGPAVEPMRPDEVPAFLAHRRKGPVAVGEPA